MSPKTENEYSVTQIMLSKIEATNTSLQGLMFGMAYTVPIVYWLLYFQGVLRYDKQATEWLKAHFNTRKSCILWQIIYISFAIRNIKSKYLHINKYIQPFDNGSNIKYVQISWSLNLCYSILYERRLYACDFLRMSMPS